MTAKHRTLLLFIGALGFVAFFMLAGGVLAAAKPVSYVSQEQDTPLVTLSLPGVTGTQVATSTPSLESTPTPLATITSTLVVLPTETYSSSLLIPTLTATLDISLGTTPVFTAPITSTAPVMDTGTTIYLPLAYHVLPPVYIPPTKELFCRSPNSAIPDNLPSGVDSAITIPDNSKIVDLDVLVHVNHTWVGDLKVKLTRYETDRTITLIDRVGYPATNLGCSYDNIRTILDDEISSSVASKCASSPAGISGIYQPETALETFDGQDITGNWILNVSDRAVNDTGRLTYWCLVASISPLPPPPTPAPDPPSFPSQAIINNVTGRNQALPLDCESRSAVDWANYFGRRINEIEFFNNLPTSDNPDVGFVGNVYGQWGQIPPNAYGVHAEPVAALLRQYGVTAYAHRPLSWDMLRAEIAAGRPVFVWIVGNVVNGAPDYYTPADGLHTIVARYEHTVLVTGYTQSNVYYLNGDTIYTKSVAQFLDSWSALGNMAITANP
ncbi:MAG: hypothetical protein A2W33_05875 [Chloroflexi bacterium RBG_16_52_11]|nr:MAG: hypothetical protein A2W33_05875 [Chloroflexi bacterium RBG_16_52_11]